MMKMKKFSEVLTEAVKVNRIKGHWFAPIQKILDEFEAAHISLEKLSKMDLKHPIEEASGHIIMAIVDHVDDTCGDVITADHDIDITLHDDGSHSANVMVDLYLEPYDPEWDGEGEAPVLPLVNHAQLKKAHDAAIAAMVAQGFDRSAIETTQQDVQPSHDHYAMLRFNYDLLV